MLIAYKLQKTGLSECWDTFLFDENHDLFIPVDPFMPEHTAACHAEFQGVQVAWFLDQLYAPAEFMADQLPDVAEKIRLLVVLIKKEFAADSLRQPHPWTSEDPVIKTLPNIDELPAPDALN